MDGDVMPGPWLAFRRIANSPPPERELLAIEADGSFAMWRSNGPIVGRFAGVVPDVAGLRRLVEATTDVEPVRQRRLPADAAEEVLEVGRRKATVEADRDVDGPWGPLFERARELLEFVTDQPRAALTMEVNADGVRVEHRGTDVLPVEFENAALEVTVRRGGTIVAKTVQRGLGQGHVDAGPAWSWTIPVEADAQGDTLDATLRFVAKDEGIFVPMRLSG